MTLNPLGSVPSVAFDGQSTAGTSSAPSSYEQYTQDDIGIYIHEDDSKHPSPASAVVDFELDFAPNTPAVKSASLVEYELDL